MKMTEIIKWVGVVFLIFVLALGLLGCGGGQGYNSPATGNIAGTVKDEADVIIVGATVVVEEADLSAITDADGYYILENIPVGTYDVATFADNHYPQTATVTVEKDKIVNQDVTLQAIQIHTVYDLTISSTEGGSVTTPGEGIFTCEAGTVVDLVAEADDGYRFVEWAGDVSTIGDITAAVTNITMSGNYSITARSVAVYDLAISSTEGGSVTTPGEGTFTYDAGTVVDLVATPDDGYLFVEWTGDVGTIVDVTAAATNITMSGNYSITASFAMEATPVRVESITYTTKGGHNNDKHLNITVLLLDDMGEPVVGASVSATLYRNDGSSWNFQGTTDLYGTVTFQLNNHGSGCYWTVVTAVAAEGLEWDGVTPENGYCKK